MKLIENSILEFRGIREEDNPIILKGSGLRVHARRLENYRPVGGKLQKVKGSQYHSVINYKMADRPTTLIRYIQDGGTARFLSTAWDNIFKYAGSVWEALLNSRTYDTTQSIATTPSGLLYGAAGGALQGEHKSYVNRPFDYMTYKDTLYFTDGYNLPMKYLSGGTETLGTWGFKTFTSATPPLDSVLQADAGVMSGAYNYYASLYDSVRGLTGERGTIARLAEPVNVQVWIHLFDWCVDNNYDMENEFANQLRIWRSGVAGSADLYLVKTLAKGMTTSGNGTIVDNGATGTLTDAAKNFATLGVLVGYAVRVGATYYQVTVVGPGGDNTKLTIEDGGGNNYTGAVGAQHYTIWPGFIDNDADITDQTRYHGELDPVQDHSAPVRCKYCVMFSDVGNRAFMAGDPDNPNRLYWSEIDTPDYFPIANYRDIDPDDGDFITGLVKFQGKLFIFKRMSVSILNVLGGHPFEWQLTPLAISVGAEHIRVITDCDGVLIFVNTAGVWRFDGRSLRNISNDLNNDSYIPLTWRDDVVLSKLEDARAVFNEARNEYWLSLVLDDARGLYDGAATDYGEISEGTPAFADDGSGHPQANMTLGYRLDTGQWFMMTELAATAWVAFRGAADEGEIYRGNYHAAVFREDSIESKETVAGHSGQATSTAAAGAATITDAGGGFTTDEWAGYSIRVWHFPSAGNSWAQSTETHTIDSNTGTVITITDGWVADIAVDDYYIIYKSTTGQSLPLLWRTSDLTLDSIRETKQFYEMIIRLMGNGNVSIAYMLDADNLRGGSWIEAITSASYFWGETTWGGGEWDSGDEVLTKVLNFNADAEARFIALKVTLPTAVAFELTLLSLGYKLHAGNRWRP